MLFLSLYEALDHLPTKRELYRRCHEMGDLAVAGLEEVNPGFAALLGHSNDIIPTRDAI